MNLHSKTNNLSIDWSNHMKNLIGQTLDLTNDMDKAFGALIYIDETNFKLCNEFRVVFAEKDISEKLYDKNTSYKYLDKNNSYNYSMAIGWNVIAGNIRDLSLKGDDVDISNINYLSIIPSEKTPKGFEYAIGDYRITRIFEPRNPYKFNDIGLYDTK
jgi:hypothetical protein